MRRCGEHDQGPFLVSRETGKEIKTLLSTFMSAYAGVRFIDDNKLWTSSSEGVATPFGLDVIQANHGERVGIEKRLRDRKAALQF